MRLQFALGEPCKQFHQIFLAMSGIAFHKRTPEHTNNGVNLEEWQIKRDTWNVTRRETNYQEASAPCHATQYRLRIIAPNWIKSHVNTFPTRKLFDAFLQILTCIIDYLICPVL